MQGSDVKYAAVSLVTVLYLLAAAAPTVAQVFSETWPDATGALITTIVDTDQRSVRYEFDVTALAYSYSQLKIAQTGFPVAAIVEVWPDQPQSPYATGFIYLEVTGPGGATETQFEVQYQTAEDPPAANWIELHYTADYSFRGFASPPIEAGNVQVTYREPEGGFPDGQEDNVFVGAYTPKLGLLQADAFLPAVQLLLLGDPAN
jgi:hypothetical protein